MATVKKIKRRFEDESKGRLFNDQLLQEESLNVDDPKIEELNIIAQEVKIVKSLACNDITKRNKQMKNLRKWLQLRSNSSFPFEQENFMRLWKGLYYNMWYSDKPLVQEELAEQLGKLLECFEGNLKNSVHFFGAFLNTMCIEWFGIDQWRIDKFLMLARRMLRYMFKLLKDNEWSINAIQIFNNHAEETVLCENVTAKGLTMHYLDIFLEELAKISEGDITSGQVSELIKPFVTFMATQKDFTLISHCRTRVFYHLLYQSALGREYSEKYQAWKELGFPTKNIDDLEKIESGDKQEHESVDDEIKHYDPRAGNVDVFMPELPLDAEPILNKLEELLIKTEATKRRKILKKLIDTFKKYQKAEFPLGIKKMPRFEDKSKEPLINNKIEQLENLENELYGMDRKLKQLNKRKRRKLLKSLNFDEIDESNYEQTLEKALPKDYLLQRRKRSQKALMTGWLEEELTEDDLAPKKAKKQEPRKHCLENRIVKNKLKPSFKENTQHVREEDLKVKQNETQQLDVKSKANIVSEESKLISARHVKPSQFAPGELKVLKISDPTEMLTPKPKKIKPTFGTSQWDRQLGEGEIEYFLPSRKLKLQQANSELVLNPLAKKFIADNHSTPVRSKNTSSVSAANTQKTPGSSTKKVKIALKHNTSQNPSEYIQQIKSSPNIPYDAKKKPVKGLLKPNAIPSPINPFYKKISLKIVNDTI